MIEAPTMMIIILVFVVAFVIVYMDFKSKKESFTQDFGPMYAPINTSTEEDLELGLRIPTLSELPCGPQCCKHQNTYSCSKGCVCMPSVQEQTSKFPFYMPRPGIYAGDRFRVWSDCYDPQLKDRPQNVII